MSALPPPWGTASVGVGFIPVAEEPPTLPDAFIGESAIDFQTGASLSSRITTIVAAIIAAIASFFLLPVEGALLTTFGIGALASLCSCSNSTVPDQQQWIRSFFNFSNWNWPLFPVAQDGRRIIPGQGHQPFPVRDAPVFVVHRPQAPEPQIQRGRHVPIRRR